MLLTQLQSEQESSEEELAKAPTEVVAESSAVPITESAVSPSQVSDGWARAAESEWNQIDERISSGQTPQPDDEAATDKK